MLYLVAFNFKQVTLFCQIAVTPDIVFTPDSELGCGLTDHRFASASDLKLTTLTFPPVTHNWVIQGLGMSSRFSVTGHIKDPVLGHRVLVVGFLLVSFISYHHYQTG